MHEEEWRAIPGHPGYEVSDQGRLRSWHLGSKKHRLAVEPRIIHPWVNHKTGYLQVSFYNWAGRKGPITKTVHRLVALAFLPNPDNLPFVCHRDDNRRNNAVDNLYWGSRSDNTKDAMRHDRFAKGEKQGCSRLTREQVQAIRQRMKAGEKQFMLAKEYGIDRNTIYLIVRRATWDWLKDD